MAARSSDSKVLRTAFLVPAAVLVVFGLLNQVSFYRTAEQRVYDVFLHIKPPVPQRDDVLFMSVDDTAIAQVGLWPWSRDYMARGLVLLRELDSSYVVFDIEYVDDSPRAVDSRYLEQELPLVFDREFGSVQGYLRDLFGAIVAGQIPLEEASDYIEDLAGLTEHVKQQLQAAVLEVARDNDRYLGQAARFHGQAYFTVNVLREDDPSVFDRQQAARAVALPSVELAAGASIRTGVDIRPAIPKVLAGAAGAGFPNVVVDSDGVRRRIDLVASFEDQYFAQLATAPLLDWLGNPEVVVRRDRVEFRGALHPDRGEPTDIVVPLATDGRMLINWPKGKFEDSFRHETFWRLVFDWETEDDMVELLRAMHANGYLQFHDDADTLLALYDYMAELLEDVLEGGDRSQIDEWRGYRAMFFSVLGALLESEAEIEYLRAVQEAIDSGDLDPDTEALYRELQQQASDYYEALRRRYTAFVENRAALERVVPGSFIIIGWVGTSTTDIGVTPFDEEYMNVGTHAAVLNTILQQRFLDDLPWWVSLAVMLAIALLVSLIIRNLDPTPSLAIGFGSLLLVAAGGVALFLLTGVYLNLVTPLAGVLVSFVTLTAVKFVRENQQKTYIRNAFTRYLAADVVNQVIKDPEALGLGGKERHLTAMFTDVKGFSTIAEKLSAEKLVELLNRYLTGMTDIILEERGTVDKFEGDAIICFWGAPTKLHPDDEQARKETAIRACRSAIAMKKVEGELNRMLWDERFFGDEEVRLLTRIGVNSGQMVCGNMGTFQRMDYTAMGHHMNLAARLEGVNKQYGTWVLVSESTYNDTGRAFSIRKLDRVRVVGVTEPVRLFELVDLREEVDKDETMIRKLRLFNAGLTAFEPPHQDWAEAKRIFDEFVGEFPDDGPGKLYAGRAAENLKKLPKGWDGVYNLTSK